MFAIKCPHYHGGHCCAFCLLVTHRRHAAPVSTLSAAQTDSPCTSLLVFLTDVNFRAMNFFRGVSNVLFPQAKPEQNFNANCEVIKAYDEAIRTSRKSAATFLALTTQT
jgi:hypothetical protein